MDAIKTKPASTIKGGSFRNGHHSVDAHAQRSSHLHKPPLHHLFERDSNSRPRDHSEAMRPTR
ncbi:uncharacterized protein HKW66_Vig0197150 [Vigna angularis]|uniref:Uncharacterized protein n=1 Tax=Phaseolus angularis TaxID=3914 RepID=A0A8T0KQ37_PHAAN|nr:uncharacterized protein HKW66_Vig0197150 [Vigna angularis]